MAASSRRWIWLIAASLLAAAVVGLLLFGGGRWFGQPKVDIAKEAPADTVTIPLPGEPSSLVWSVDGRYLAAGTWGRSTGEQQPGELYVADVAKSEVHVTLKTDHWVEGVAFSPDGMWLAVATRPSIPAGMTPAELILFEVPAFAVKHTTKATNQGHGFIDLAWSADSKSLHVIEGPVDGAQGKAVGRRWTLPGFAEQPAINVPEVESAVAVAVSPDGRTVAFGEQGSTKSAVVIRLFDVEKREATKTFRIDESFRPPRLGFRADGKAIGVFDTQRLTWLDAETGRPTKVDQARFAVLPAGLGHLRSWDAISLDGRWHARGHERHRGFGDLGWDNRGKEFGAFIDLTEIATAATRTLRVGDASAPPVAFSADATKFAAAVKSPRGTFILILPVPK